ncbi:unnamed protein product [Ilex paraguariensis]|uniref:Uncharacterized protein n=1 Tax=Ilex paraguariensis TaxID=185542 RepID=A0ABC8T8B6_9AQUA
MVSYLKVKEQSLKGVQISISEDQSKEMNKEQRIVGAQTIDSAVKEQGTASGLPMESISDEVFKEKGVVDVDVVKGYDGGGSFLQSNKEEMVLEDEQVDGVLKETLPGS